MTWDEHHFELEGSGHVVNGREARIGRGALEVGNLALAEAQLCGELSLTQLPTQAPGPQNLCQA